MSNEISHPPDPQTCLTQAPGGGLGPNLALLCGTGLGPNLALLWGGGVPWRRIQEKAFAERLT